MDNKSSKALREERAKIAKEIEALYKAAQAEQRELSPEEQAQWDKLNAEYDAFKALISSAEVAERANEIAREQAQPVERRVSTVATEPTYKRNRFDPIETAKLSLRGWIRHQYGLRIESRHYEAMEHMGVKPDQREYEIRLYPDAPHSRKEARALSAITGSAGNYTIEDVGFAAPFETALLQFGGMRNVADVIRTSTAADLPFPYSDTTDQKGAILGENVAVSEQDVDFGLIKIGAYKYTSKLIRVPVELLEDTGINLSQWLAERCAERIGRIQEDHFCTGTGVNQPYGWVNQATLGVTAASATAITADEIKNLVQSVDPAYRPGSVFVMNDPTRHLLSKLVDGNSRYIWGSEDLNGDPESSTLLGYKVQISQTVNSGDAPGSADIVIGFGQFSKYKIRDVNTVRLRKLEERYADQDQVGMVMFMRTSAALIDAGTHPVKYLKMAT